MVEWAHEHWFLTFILAYTLLEGGLRCVNRILRTIKVIARGWPTMINMDADGDIVHPEAAKESEG